MEIRAETAALPDRLDSWKEIASYLRRDVRTLRRWEKDEGLPVHRLQHGKQGTVYAYRVEIDAWWESRQRELERASTARATRGRLLVAAVAAVALAAAAVWAIWRRPVRTAETSPAAFRFSVPLADEGASRMRVSPDGRELAFSTCCTDRRIWRHSLVSNTTSSVPGTQGGIDPFWSPDGTRLAFFADDNTLKVIDSSGGTPVTIGEARGAIWGGTWSTDGTIVFSAASQLFRVSAGGGKPEPMAINDSAGPGAHRKVPQVLPDGRHLIYFVDDLRHSGTYMASIDAPDGTRLVESPYPAMLAAPSHLLYIRGTALVAQEIDVNARRLIGEATMLVPDVAPTGLLTSALVAASNTGVLAFMTARTHYDVAPDGRMLVRQMVGIDPPTLTMITNWRALAGR